MAEIVCPHNKEVICGDQQCQKCGWDPTVAKMRLAKISGGMAKMANSKLFKVPFTGYCEVWAESPEEAADMAENIDAQFFAHYDYGDPICMEKEDANE